MTSLRVNAQIFFLCGNVYSGSFYHFHHERYQIPFNLTDMGLNPSNFGESWSGAQWGSTNLKKENNFSNKILG